MSKGNIRLIVLMKDVKGVYPKTLVFQVLDGEYYTACDAKRAAGEMFKPGMKLHTAIIGDMFVV